MNAFKILLMTCLICGCTSQNKKTEIVKNMLIGGAIGALVGQAQESHKEAYTVLYSSIGANAGALTTAFMDKDVQAAENAQLKKKIEEFENNLKPKLVNSGESLYSAPLPNDLVGLVEPGEWKRYKMDQWIQDPAQPNTWYRQVEMFEIIPPISK